ncbi:MAG: hypothetical protein DI617_09320, partial [Streptococcus pyogenes]
MHGSRLWNPLAEGEQGLDEEDVAPPEAEPEVFVLPVPRGHETQPVLHSRPVQLEELDGVALLRQGEVSLDVHGPRLRGHHLEVDLEAPEDVDEAQHVHGGGRQLHDETGNVVGQHRE